ncbi:MAG: preprotein translocase subunit SecG [Gammaproteobacteria bacterium]
MQNILLVVHVLVAFALIGIILVQHGRGADTGAAFGSGASTTVFGARGSATFLSRVTAILAIVFFSNSLFLGYLATQRVEVQSLMEHSSALPPAPAASAPEAPAAPAPQGAPAPADLPELPGK